MLVQSFLAFAVIALLCYGRLPFTAALIVSAAVALFLLRFGRRGSVFAVDGFAQRSPLRRWNPLLKTGITFVLLVLTLLLGRPAAELAVFIFVSAVTVFAGKIRLRDYFSVFTGPLLFVLFGALALLVEYRADNVQNASRVLLAFTAGPGAFVLTEEAQARTGLVLARVCAAESALFFLSLTTPLPQLIDVLRRLRTPQPVIELMYLIYRYIFLLLQTQQRMRQAAASRQGYATYRTSLRSTALVYGNLLAKSYREAGKMFDAMESRCYDGQLRFLP